MTARTAIVGGRIRTSHRLEKIRVEGMRIVGLEFRGGIEERDFAPRHARFADAFELALGRSLTETERARVDQAVERGIVEGTGGAAREFEGFGNGYGPQLPGNPPVNDGRGTGAGNPGRRHGGRR